MSGLVTGEQGDIRQSCLHHMEKREFFAINCLLEDKRMGEVVDHQ